MRKRPDNIERNKKVFTGKAPWNKGKSFSDESKLKISQSHKGQKTTDTYGFNIRYK